MTLNGLTTHVLQEPKKFLAIILSIFFACLLLIEVFAFFQDEDKIIKLPQQASTKTKSEKITLQSALFIVPIFGNYVAPLSAREIKQSTLDLEIVGILFSPKSKESQVLIRAKEGEEHSYVVGDILPGGAKINQINKNNIVVLYEGELESLSLPKNELLFDKPPKPLIRE